MKTYYELLAPVVLAYVTSYQTDFTVHDKKGLDGYTGEFYYAIMTTGTDLFCIDRFEKALQTLIDEENPNFWTSRGLRELYQGTLPANSLSFCQSGILFEGDRNRRFFIGKNGSVKEYPRELFLQLFKKRLETTQRVIDQLKGSLFVLNLSRETFDAEQKRRREMAY